MSTPTKIDNNGFVIVKPDDNEKIQLSMTTAPLGISLYYDQNTAPKNFSLTSSGATWTNGTNTYTTPLQKVGALQLAFSSIEEPTSTNILKINDTINLTDGVDNLSINPTSLTFGSNAYIEAPNCEIILLAEQLTSETQQSQIMALKLV